MNKYTLAIVFLCTLMLTSCATTPKHFPAEDIVIAAPTAFGKVYALIKKGNLDKEHEGEWWLTFKDFIKYKGVFPNVLDEEI